jgi:hypothetical protein
MVAFFFFFCCCCCPRPSIFDQQPYLLWPYNEADVCLDETLTRKFFFIFRPALGTNERAETLKTQAKNSSETKIYDVTLWETGILTFTFSIISGLTNLNEFTNRSTIEMNRKHENNAQILQGFRTLSIVWILNS